MRDVRKVKALQSQLKNMISDSEILKIELSNKQKDYTLKLSNIKKLKQEIDKLNSSTELNVSEHAIVRYFERVKGFDIEEIKKEILTKQIISQVEVLGGTGKYPNQDFSVVMKEFTVTTIL